MNKHSHAKGRDAQAVRPYLYKKYFHKFVKYQFF